MKQDKDWIDVMRSTLRDAETPPPADGWARLERELGKAPVRLAPASRVPAWRIHWPRIAAAAAAVMICIAAGEYLWSADPDLEGFDGNVISEAVVSGSAVDPILPQKTAVNPTTALAMAEPASSASVNAQMPARQLKALTLRRSVETPDTYSDALPQVETIAGEETNDAKVDPATPKNTLDGPTAQHSKSATRAWGQAARKTSEQPSQRPLYEDDFVAKAPPRKKTSFSLYGGGGISGGSGPGASPQRWYDSSNSSGGSGGSISLMKQYDYVRGSFRHYQPLSFGLSVRKEFAHRLSLESGVNYTFLHSSVSLYSGSERIDQKLHFIGVPLRVNWQFFERGRFSLYIGAGGMLEKCLSARFDGKTAKEPQVQWSALGAVGAQYRLGGTVGLYFEPEGSYYFTETKLRTVRTDSPLTLTLRMGVRLSF